MPADDTKFVNAFGTNQTEMYLIDDSAAVDRNDKMVLVKTTDYQKYDADLAIKS